MAAIAGSLSFSLLMVCTRLVRGTSDLVLVTTQTVGALVFGAIAAPFTWVALDLRDTLLLIGAAVIIAAGIYIFMRERKAAKELALIEPP